MSSVLNNWETGASEHTHLLPCEHSYDAETFCLDVPMPCCHYDLFLLLAMAISVRDCVNGRMCGVGL